MAHFAGGQSARSVPTKWVLLGAPKGTYPARAPGSSKAPKAPKREAGGGKKTNAARAGHLLW